MSQEQDKVFFRNFSLIVGALAVLMIIFMVAARIISVDEEAIKKRQAASVSKVTAPMGEVSVAGQPQEAASEQATTEVATTGGAPAPASAQGKQVYDGLCMSCHGSGIPGIPQKGDKAAWEPRIAQGKDTLYQHALQGFTGASGMMMPPKGGGTNTDDEVKAAVDYIVSNSQ